MERDILLLKDNSRVAPADVPRDALGFKSWIYFACVEWPRELTVEAFLAWEDIHCRSDDAKLICFLQSYAEWWFSPEGEKIRRMSPDQADSSSRTYYLSRAREATIANSG